MEMEKHQWSAVLVVGETKKVTQHKKNKKKRDDDTTTRFLSHVLLFELTGGALSQKRHRTTIPKIRDTHRQTQRPNDDHIVDRRSIQFSCCFSRPQCFQYGLFRVYRKSWNRTFACCCSLIVAPDS